MTAIRIESLSREFGGLRAVEDLTMHVNPGEVVSLIGPNGAGKTTVLNLISGYYEVSRGSISLGGEEVADLPPYRRARKGLQRTFQNLQICFNMTAIENVLLGAHTRLDHRVLTAMFRRRMVHREEQAFTIRARELMQMVGLEKWVNRDASEMPYGALKRLEIARALAANPRFLLLDEPAAGLNPDETTDLGRLIREIADMGIAVLLVEHDMKLVMDISDRVVVLDFGRRLTEGKPEEVSNNPDVVRAYLGTD